MANSVTTIAAREKFAKAHAGTAALPKVTQVAWGTGGHDPANGDAVIPPTADLIAVPGEFLRKVIDSQSFPVSTTARFTSTLTGEEGNGKDVSACGLYDEAGTLVAVKTFKPKAVDLDTTITIDWDEEF